MNKRITIRTDRTEVEFVIDVMCRIREMMTAIYPSAYIPTLNTVIKKCENALDRLVLEEK